MNYVVSFHQMKNMDLPVNFKELLSQFQRTLLKVLDEITKNNIKDSDRTKLDILTQIEQVISFVKKHINKEIIITGQPRNTEKWQYPLEAIREIVINMIIHRNYRSASNSGIRRIIEYFKDANMPQPEFRNISDGFMVTAFAAESTTKVGEKVGEKLTANQKTIVSLMQTNPYIIAKALSEKVGISVRKIETNIKKLKGLDYIKRIGPAKGRHWEIINK